jgi:hypothetical protein
MGDAPYKVKVRAVCDYKVIFSLLSRNESRFMKSPVYVSVCPPTNYFNRPVDLYETWYGGNAIQGDHDHHQLLPTPPDVNVTGCNVQGQSYVSVDPKRSHNYYRKLHYNDVHNFQTLPTTARMIKLEIDRACSMYVNQGRGVHVTGVSAAYTFKLNKNILSE